MRSLDLNKVEKTVFSSLDLNSLSAPGPKDSVTRPHLSGSEQGRYGVKKMRSIESGAVAMNLFVPIRNTSRAQEIVAIIVRLNI